MMRSTPRATHIQHTPGLGFELQSSRLARSIDPVAVARHRTVVMSCRMRLYVVWAYAHDVPRRTVVCARTHARTGTSQGQGAAPGRPDGSVRTAARALCCGTVAQHRDCCSRRGAAGHSRGTALQCDFDFRCEYLDWVRCSLTSPTSASSGRATRDSARSSIACAAQPYTERPQRAPLDGGWKTSADGIC